MVDRIREKYSRLNNEPSYFNEFNEPEIIKHSCKSCILFNFLFSLINTSYFVTILFILHKLYKFTDNDFLKDPNYTNNNLNNFANIIKNICANNSAICN